MALLLLIVGLLLFVGLVVVHELGHFIAARRSGVQVEEFGIGFPPRAWKKRMKSGFLLTLNWLPLGGFVKLKGEYDADRSPGSFGAASLPAKVKIMTAGVAMNLATAFIMLTLAAVVGLPKLVDDQFTVASDTKVVRSDVLVGYIEPGSPAEKAGLQVRDQLLAVSAVEGKVDRISSVDAFPDLTAKYAGKEVVITYLRGGQERQTTAQLRTNEEVTASRQTDNPKGHLGVSPAEYVLRRSTWSAPVVALGLMKQFTEATYKGLGSAIANLFRGDTGRATQQVSGPVGVFVILREGSLLGYQFVLVIIAVISLTLAILNILPIPALDGGRLFVTLLFRVLRRPLTKKTEATIHGTGFALLMLLFVLVTIIDVRRFF